jgi:hypothetical protein
VGTSDWLLHTVPSWLVNSYKSLLPPLDRWPIGPL